MNKPELKERIFDIIYGLAEDFFRQNNPCKFINGRCTAERTNGCCGGWHIWQKKSSKYPTVRICNYLDEYTGCTVQALGCKLHICYAGQNKSDWEFYRGYLNGLKHVAEYFGINTNCYMAKDKALEENK